MGDDVRVITMLRPALVLAAALVAAWFGLRWAQARDTGRAQVLVGAAHISPEQAREVRALLGTAGTLSPDRTVDIIRAQLALDQRRYRVAVAILNSVTGAEPMNLEAWTQLAVAAARAGEPRLAQTAFAQASKLLGRSR